MNIADASRCVQRTSLNFIDILPTDCLQNIVTFLPIHSRFVGMGVCTRWRNILLAKRFWIYIGASCVVEFARLSCHDIVASDLSPISGLISDDALKHILHRFRLVVGTLILDGCHRITGESLAVIADSTLQNASFKWCDGIMEAGMLSHIETQGRRYQKIDLRGCHKMTGHPLFEKCEKRAVDEGMLHPDATFSRPNVFIQIRRMFGAESHFRVFRVHAHRSVHKVLAAWCDREGRDMDDLLFTCNGRIFHYALCAAEMLVILHGREPLLQVHVHDAAAVGGGTKMWSIARDAEAKWDDIYEPMMHTYSDGYEQVMRMYRTTTHLDIERMFCDMCHTGNR